MSAKGTLQTPSAMTLSRSRVELDLASMVYCRRFILTAKKDWFLHVRADASPQGGRDFFMIEADVCEMSPTLPFRANDPIHKLLGDGRFKIRTRLMPVQIIGCRAASAVHKAKLLLKSLALESDDLQLSLERTASLIFDYGAESGIWSMPSMPDAPGFATGDSSGHHLFPNALPIGDCDHALHHVSQTA